MNSGHYFKIKFQIGGLYSNWPINTTFGPKSGVDTQKLTTELGTTTSFILL